MKLLWVMQSEINNHGFEIERRLEAESSKFTGWEKIYFIQGKGNSANPVTYEFIDNKLLSGKYQYRLKQLDYNGNYAYYSLSQDIIISKPAVFELGQNYPNPSNPVSRIDFQIPFNGK